MSNVLIVDLESRPDPKLIKIKEDLLTAKANLKDPEKIKADLEEKTAGLHKELSTDTDYAEIVCIGVIRNEEKKMFMSVKEFADWYNPIYDINDIWVGYNIKSFDLPLLIKQGLKQGIKLPYTFLQGLTKRYYSPNCRDLQEIVNYQAKWKSLDEILTIYFGTPKKPIDFQTASVEERVEHCYCDISDTKKLYELFKPIL